MKLLHKELRVKDLGEIKLRKLLRYEYNYLKYSEKRFQSNEKRQILKGVPYRQLIEEIMYLTTTSRPEIGFVVSLVDI